MLYTPTSRQPQHPDDVPPLELVDFAFSRIKDAIYIVNDRERFCYVNDEACRMLGYSSLDFSSHADTQHRSELEKRRGESPLARSALLEARADV
ncbi:hypothetical protein OS12_45950 [Dickeya oryzae]